MPATVPLRIFLPNVLLIGAVAALVAGGVWITIATIGTVLLGSAADETLGDSRQVFGQAARAAYTVNLLATLPLILVMTVCFLQYFVDGDPLGVEALLARFGISFGSGPVAVSDAVSKGVAVILAGIFYAISAFAVAHELIHWTENRIAVTSGRILLAFTFASTFSISHLYTHHRQVGTYNDPTTARRGERFSRFIVRSVWGHIYKAYEHEAERLRRRGHRAFSWRNRALRGDLFSVAIVAFVIGFSGWRGLLAYLGAAAVGKLIVELINYVQHFGVVRVEGTPVEVRHTWDCHRAISGAILYNLSRHAHHHKTNSRVWDVECVIDGPMLPYGYKTMAMIALVPPLYRRLMAPLVSDWDARFASDGELRLIRERGWETAGARARATPAAARASTQRLSGAAG